MNYGIEEVQKWAATVEGWFSDRQGRFLYTKARQCSGKGVIVEIGSWKGKSTVWLGSGSLAGNRVPVYAVDPHNCWYSEDGGLGRGKELTTLREFEENMKRTGVSGVVRPIVATSEEAIKNWKDPIELLLIDGDHSYDAVKKDIDLWLPYVIDGGIIAFDDSFDESIKKVLHEKTII